jgi:delta1-piperideine-2-carboxylate reductase
MKVAIAELLDLVTRCLRRAGMSPSNATLVAHTIVAAERDGARSHGLQRLPGYVSSLACGWVDGRARPVVAKRAPGAIHVDARNGFAQVALARGAPLVRKAAERTGVALLSIGNSHHYASLWPDVEPFAVDGFLAIAMVNSRSHMPAWGGHRKILGTNPVAFACPRRDAPPVIWDQASSAMSQGEVLVARAAGHTLPAGVGVDRDGAPTTDPNAVLDGGALLPFADPKGSSIAFMVEVLVAGLGGSRFGFEDTSRSVPGAQTSNAGQWMLLISPERLGAPNFPDRVETLIQNLRDFGAQRLPADARYARRRRAEAEGIEIADDRLADLAKQAGVSPRRFSLSGSRARSS